jgi:hypothetical protein
MDDDNPPIPHQYLAVVSLLLNFGGALASVSQFSNNTLHSGV